MLWDSEDVHWGNAQFLPGIITYLEIKKLKYYYISLTQHLFTSGFLILKRGFDHATRYNRNKELYGDHTIGLPSHLLI